MKNNDFFTICESGIDIFLLKGSIVVECGRLLLREGYKIKILNTINFKKSMHYNPFAYIHSEKDILKLVTTLIANTKGEGKSGDDFWVKAETLLYVALSENLSSAHHRQESCRERGHSGRGQSQRHLLSSKPNEGNAERSSNMNNLKEHIHENGIDYVLCGDYYIPEIQIPRQERPIGHYGKLRKAYLREFRPVLYQGYISQGKLFEHLTNVNKQAQERMDVMMEQIIREWGVDEALKAENEMGWVQIMNQARHCADEVIKRELIYC